MSSPQSVLEEIDADEVIDLGGHKAELLDMLQQLGELIALARVYASAGRSGVLAEVFDDTVLHLQHIQRHVRENIADDV